VEVRDVKDSQFLSERDMLIATLDKFRADMGFGRAISAPQIGVNKRLIALNLGKSNFCILNPVITNKSTETFTMWDDCMSFPWLMVKVQRHTSISISYIDEHDGSQKTWENIDQAVSELLQHEIDHLDGILAVDRALDKEAIISREVYTSNQQFFNSQVDYFIRPTITKDS